MNFLNFIFTISILTLVSCTGGDFKESKKFINGEVVSADTLNLGQQVYIEYCSSCHGLKGDGNGVAAKGSTPPPRNFTQGLYKFGLVADSGLPTDEDFHRIIKNGLKGTAMLPWDVSDKQVYAVTQYIKTFAPQVWEAKDRTVGTKIELSPNPYVASTTFAINKGKEVYHVTGQCQSCHRAYVTKAELSDLNKKVSGAPLTEFDSEMYKMKLQTSEYYYHDSNERLVKFLPPDFTWHEIRSGSTVDEIAMRLAAGVTGTGMPMWKGVLTDEEIWAVAYYVKSLSELKNTDAREQLMKELENQE
jgi:mono/diheme cytochrome c family protein